MENREDAQTTDLSANKDKRRPKRTLKYEISVELKEKLKDPDVLEYINALHKYIEKQRRKIRRLKRSKKTSDAETQTIAEGDSKPKEPKSIAEEITEAAEAATQKLGFAFDESSGLYYDYTTGYYYNAEYGLYFDRNTGTYMSYNQETKTYEFHSKVEMPEEKQEQDDRKLKTKTKETDKASKRKRLEQTDNGLEDGECSNSSCEDREEVCLQDGDEEMSELSNSFPCMRIIVKKSSVPGLKQGSLHIVTCKGGSLGREGDHSVVIPDINVSKYHVRFTFDEERLCFLATDVGSQNGTLLNGNRMSASKVESEAIEVVHGSQIEVGSTVLLCHIHAGYQTCGHCEPGLIASKNEEDKEENAPVSKSSRSDSHKKQLKQLRKKFGISGYDERPVNLGSGYTDRAQVRRETVGSQNPHEKTQVASVNESISSENKGFKMLAKMGWSQGQSLGKREEGLTEPINVIGNEGTAGIGSSTNATTNVRIDKQNVWKKAQERFDKLPETNALSDSD